MLTIEREGEGENSELYYREKERTQNSELYYKERERELRTQDFITERERERERTQNFITERERERERTQNFITERERELGTLFIQSDSLFLWPVVLVVMETCILQQCECSDHLCFQ